MSEILLKDIIEKYLVENKYDGLTDTQNYCGCFLDDLMPCDDPSMHCAAAVKQACDYSVDASTIDDRERVECSHCEGVKGEDSPYHLIKVKIEDIPYD